MILTDREIKNSLEARLIEIDPQPAPDAFSSTSVDLTLDPIIRIFKDPPHGTEVAIDPGLPNYEVTKLLEDWTDRYEIDSQGYILERIRFRVCTQLVDSLSGGIVIQLSSHIEGLDHAAFILAE